MTGRAAEDPAHEGAAAPVLEVFDRALLTAIPLLLLGVLVAFRQRAIAASWSTVTVVAMSLVGTTVLVARRRGVRWRAAAYALVILAAASGALWDLGPFTGVGALYGLGILFAGAFLPRTWLFVAAAVVLASITVRSLMPGAGGLLLDRSNHPTDVWFWVGTAITCGTIAWLALRVLEALIVTLERSYRSVEDAYRRESEARLLLESSRADLEELAQVEMVGRLAGGVAHDVNNALAAILAASDVLATDVRTPDQRRHLAELESACHHAADLVRDLLWTGRRFPGRTTEPANLVEVLRRCLERVRRVARGIRVEHQLDGSLDVAVSPEHLEQTLFGLIVGVDRIGVTQLAVSATRDGAFVVITLDGVVSARSPGAARLRAMQAKLGVSAARDLVSQYGGSLLFAHRPRSMHLAVRVPASERASDHPVVTPPRARTALVVEDEPMVLRRLCQLVERRGYEVTRATTVAQALACLAARPDLLITDLQLPDGSGEQIALASYEAHPERPIIVCSGFSAEDIRRGPLRDAPLTILAKPFTVADFEAALGAVARPARASTEQTA